MDEKESQGQLSPGKPFALRPSALSAGGFGTSANQTHKPQLLRPSALTVIADKIENTTDVKKRKVDEASREGTSECDDGNKKQKVDNEATSPKGGLQLTETVIPPEGIGTFGFMNEDKVAQNRSSSTSTNSGSNSYGFVFGQNINERVTGFQDISKADSSLDGPAFEHSGETSEKEQGKKLVENANEHMKKEESSKLHLKEVEVVTGEEGERNVLQIQCKLHLLCHEKSNWIEKGRGILKLNDICKSEKYDIFQSRIVFRRQGSHQVVLNTLLWPEMCYDKVTNKSLRITAIDHENQKINIFLVTGSAKDIIQLHTAIDRRVIALIRNQDETKTAACTKENSDDDTNDGCQGVVSTSNAEGDSHPDSAGTDEEAKDDGPLEDSSEQNDSGNSNDSTERET